MVSSNRSTAPGRDGHDHGDAGISAGTFPSQDMYRTAFELTYGFTDHVEGAAHDFAHPTPSRFQYAGSKFRVRGTCSSRGELRVDWAGTSNRGN